MTVALVLVVVVGAFCVLRAWRKKRMKVPGDLVVMTQRTEQMGYEAFKRGEINPYQDVIPMTNPIKRKIFEEHQRAFEKGWARAEKEHQAMLL